MMNQEPIISFLLEENIVDDQTLETILAKQRDTGQTLVALLKGENLIDEDQLTKIIALGNKIEFVTLSPDMVEPMAAHLLSYEFVSQYNLIPVRIDKDKLSVAMSSPLNLAVRGQIEMKTGHKVVPLAATASAIRQAILFHFNVRNVTRQDIVSMRLKSSTLTAAQDKSHYDLTKAASAPVARLVASIINGAIDARASDIHIEPQEPDVKVRYRIDGILRDTIDVPASVQLEVVSHIKILAEMDISERRIPQDGHIAVSLNNNTYDLRVSSLPAVGGEKIVLRILDKNSGLQSLDDIVRHPEDNAKFRSLVANPHGMILLTGPTGCGKTTTLYSLLQHLNTPDRNIVTIEDPVEYRLAGITQVQVKSGIGVTFASVLRSVLRQDPDIILIGEIRDVETAEIAIRAALTGHLVLSTLHTNDAPGAISRLINLGIPPFLVASSLLGAVAQRLARTVCKHCKEPYQATEEELVTLFGHGKQPDKLTLYRGAGCGACFKTGYHGRRALYEILTVSPEIRKLIVSGASDDTIKQQAEKSGMRILRESGVEAAFSGETNVQELMRVIDIRD
ncbi:MAG: GspE/PulE family protein [Sedimentisphaerales bacterium]|nr:GspE/PulE family protein [Sedimentisphaerales bacterium]